MPSGASSVGIGIIGLGRIARSMADALSGSQHAHLAAVLSRDMDRARAFVARHASGNAAVRSHADRSAFLADPSVDGVYIALPTTLKEEAALASIAAGKAVLVEKPFSSLASFQRIRAAAAAAGVAFLDATHFVHHPRTRTIKDQRSKLVGVPQTLYAAVNFHLVNAGNIRFDPSLEPLGALGDIGWYTLRAAVEYLDTKGAPGHISAVFDHTQNGAIAAASALVRFASGHVLSMTVGFSAGAVVQDARLLGSAGMITLEDFLQDFETSPTFAGVDRSPSQIQHRRGRTTAAGFQTIACPTEKRAEIAMVDAFLEAVRTDVLGALNPFLDGAEHTQALVDAVAQRIF